MVLFKDEIYPIKGNLKPRDIKYTVMWNGKNILFEMLIQLFNEFLLNFIKDVQGP